MELSQLIYEVARYTGIPGRKIDNFLHTMEMCGYELAPLPRVTNAPAESQSDESSPRVAVASHTDR